MRQLFLEVVYRHSPVEMMLWGAIAIELWTCLSLFFKGSEKRWKKWIWINRTVLVLSALFILRYTLLRKSGQRTISLIPFYSFTFSRSSDRYNTLMANALLFLPIGLTVPFVLMESSVKRGVIKVTIIVALLFSTFIEVAQYIFKLGLCETDDVIFNTLGAAMGTLAFVVFSYVCFSRQDSDAPK